VVLRNSFLPSALSENRISGKMKEEYALLAVSRSTSGEAGRDSTSCAKTLISQTKTSSIVTENENENEIIVPAAQHRLQRTAALPLLVRSR